ncbi:hypothetical protein HWD94_04025 [Pseudarthrobacter equi]|uniref:hypothetical protein n=1 Tax=Pseudarthrobacter equi TaxID=728066 RepID=UPI0021BF421C|nr:hypothetical protein [Pseudarthrobacter equi]MCT9624291.1 hypothetical protein [Pseudarthrobacter equi]
MSPRVIGPSGTPLEVTEDMARGLVRDGYAVLADDEAKTVLDRSDPAVVILNPEVAPGIVLPVGNSVADITGQAAAENRPRGNASRDEWVAYALANGKTEDDLNGLKQGEIRELFADPAEGEGSTDGSGGDTPPAEGDNAPEGIDQAPNGDQPDGDGKKPSEE